MIFVNVLHKLLAVIGSSSYFTKNKEEKNIVPF